MPELVPVGQTDKLRLAEGFGAIARRYNLYLQTCATVGDHERFGIHKSGCMTTDIFGQALGVNFKKTAHKGNRAGCACMESRGVGDYNSCPNGCRYCYANKDPERALRNWREEHDPQSPLLLGHLSDGDEISFAKQRSHLATGQGSLF